MAESVLLETASGKDVARITRAITGGELERTIEGASTLTIDVHDPHRTLIRSPELQRAIDVKYDGVWFRLVKVAKGGDSVTLTFEDRDVAYLRSHKKPRKISRNKSTRAQFVRSLVREVKKSKIDFYCPEVNDRQPIKKASSSSTRAPRMPIDNVGPAAPKTPAKRTPKEREDKKQKGLGDYVGTIKGVRATTEQCKNVQRALDVADTIGAGPKATKALIVAGIGESSFQISAKDFATGTHVGIWQSNQIPAQDVEGQAKHFLIGGRSFAAGGAIGLAKAHPEWSAGTIATKVEISGQPGSFYDRYGDEADRWIEHYGGASGTDTGGTSYSTPYRRKYEFSRGKPGEPEDSWTAIQRLAEEVRWRAFMDKGTLYFISDDRLIKANAKYTWTEDTAGVHAIDFDVDQGKVSSELRVTCRTKTFDVRIGTVVAIRELGIANGRWLVHTVRQDLFGTDTEVTLVAPTPKLAEPAPEIAQHERKTTTVTGDEGNEFAGGPVSGDISTEGGAKGIVTQGARIVEQAGGSGVWVVSAYRPGSMASQGPSDHSSNDATRAARDIAVQGIDALVGPPSPKLDVGVVALGKSFGRDYKEGKQTIIDTFQWRGYRVQIIWRTPAYGGHMGHIHLGVRRA